MTLVEQPASLTVFPMTKERTPLAIQELRRRIA